MDKAEFSSDSLRASSEETISHGHSILMTTPRLELGFSGFQSGAWAMMRMIAWIWIKSHGQTKTYSEPNPSVLT